MRFLTVLCNRFSICSTFQRVCVPNNKLLCLFNTFYKNTLFLGNVTDTSLKYTLLMSMWRMSQCVLQPVSLGPRSAFGLVISAFRRVDRAPLMGFLACGWSCRRRPVPSALTALRLSCLVLHRACLPTWLIYFGGRLSVTHRGSPAVASGLHPQCKYLPAWLCGTSQNTIIILAVSGLF